MVGMVFGLGATFLCFAVVMPLLFGIAMAQEGDDVLIWILLYGVLFLPFAAGSAVFGAFQWQVLRRKFQRNGWIWKTSFGLGLLMTVVSSFAISAGRNTPNLSFYLLYFAVTVSSGLVCGWAQSTFFLPQVRRVMNWIWVTLCCALLIGLVQQLGNLINLGVSGSINTQLPVSNSSLITATIVRLSIAIIASFVYSSATGLVLLDFVAQKRRLETRL